MAFAGNIHLNHPCTVIHQLYIIIEPVFHCHKKTLLEYCNNNNNLFRVLKSHIVQWTYNEIGVYSKNIINSRYHRKGHIYMYTVKKIAKTNSKYNKKGHVYRKSKTIGNISFNRCKSKACSHIYHSLQEKPIRMRK